MFALLHAPTRRACRPQRVLFLPRTRSFQVGRGALGANSYVWTRQLSTSKDTQATQPTSVAAPAKTWVDSLPPKVRPYLYITRVDKPIGTLLLFYPCGQSTSARFGHVQVLRGSSLSLVDYHGFLRPTNARRYSADVPRNFWDGCTDNARRRVHD